MKQKVRKHFTIENGLSGYELSTKIRLLPDEKIILVQPIDEIRFYILYVNKKKYITRIPKRLNSFILTSATRYPLRKKWNKNSIHTRIRDCYKTGFATDSQSASERINSHPPSSSHNLSTPKKKKEIHCVIITFCYALLLYAMRMHLINQ